MRRRTEVSREVTEALLDKIDELQEEIKRLRAELKTCCDHDNIWKHAQEMGHTKVIDEQKAEIERLEKELEKRHTCDNPLGIPHEPE